MPKWLGGGRGTVLMILTWIIGWGLGFGGLIELLLDPDGVVLDVWPVAMAILGFFGGVVFSALFRITEGRRRFDDVALVRFAIWGSATGFALAVTALAVGMPRPVFLSVPALIGTMIGLHAVAAVGSALFFRLWRWTAARRS